jgi:tRNA A37 threonylcarbamoyladenosine biosynthesis protein TsaE
LGRISDLDPELTNEQREAVSTILFNRDQVVIFQGKAGTGKTRTLKEVIKGMNKLVRTCSRAPLPQELRKSCDRT